jgi:hypothetical protein
MEERKSPSSGGGFQLACLVLGGAWNIMLFGFAFAGMSRGTLGVMIGKALVAAFLAYMAKRGLELPDRSLLQAFGAYDVMPLFLSAVSVFNLLWRRPVDFAFLVPLLPLFPDFAAGGAGYWLAVHELRRGA